MKTKNETQAPLTVVQGNLPDGPERIALARELVKAITEVVKMLQPTPITVSDCTFYGNYNRRAAARTRDDAKKDS